MWGFFYDTIAKGFGKNDSETRINIPS